jgi:hypothetical protein
MAWSRKFESTPRTASSATADSAARSRTGLKLRSWAPSTRPRATGPGFKKEFERL